MPRSRAQRVEVEQRRELVARLYITGLTQAEIGRRCNVGQRQISKDLAVIRRNWLESSIRNFDELRGEQLAKIDKLESEYWDAWERSKAESVRKTAERSDGKDRAVVVTEAQHGDPRYLAGIERCIAQRCKLLGLDAPTKIAPTTPDGTKPYEMKMTPAEVMAEYMEVFARADSGSTDNAGG